MQFKSIENYHVKNVILGKDFNLGMISFLFHAFTFISNVPPHLKHHVVI
jgi:hypothetical protein